MKALLLVSTPPGERADVVATFRGASRIILIGSATGWSSASAVYP